jgi:lysophospholipase L1-like esterase
VTGTINETGKTIAVTMPFGTDVTSLVATFSTSGASVRIGAMTQTSGTTVNDFTSPVDYTVVAADGTTASYTVTVTVALNAAKAITAFSLAGVTGTINETGKTIAVTVPYGTNMTSLTPAIAHTGVSTIPDSAVAQDFSIPVTYTITAADGTTQQYSVSAIAQVRGKYMRVIGESLVLPSIIPGNLSFDSVVSGSVVVRSTYKANDPGCIVYQEGIDYVVDYTNGTIARTTNSRIPDFSTNVLYGQKDFIQTNFPGYTNHPFFIWVDYDTTNGESFGKPNYQTQYLTNTRAKLVAGGTFKIVSYGDSITAGRESTIPDLRFTNLYANYLQNRFPNSAIQLNDVSIPGYTSTLAISSWDSSIGLTTPDLVLLGWGMNDHNIGGSTPEQFKQNLITLVGMIKNLKNAEVILFSAFPPHNDWHYGTHRMNLYAEATKQAAIESSCAYVDVFDTWAMVLQRKDQSSLLGNNINHPNDFGHWLYFQAFEAMNF